MTDQTVSTSSQVKLSKVALFIATAVLSVAALGYLGQILYVQELQVRNASWGAGLVIEIIAIIIAIAVSFGMGREEFAPRLSWAAKSKVLTYGLLTCACVCWLFGALVLTTHGSSIPTSAQRALVGLEGRAYIVGEAAPRGYTAPTVFPIVGQRSYTFGLVHDRTIPGTQTPVETRYTVVLTARLKDSGAVTREVQRLGYSSRDQLNQELWSTIELQTAAVAQQINGTAPGILKPGDILPIPGSPFFEIVLTSVSNRS